MLSPKRTKFRKFHKVKKSGIVGNLKGLEFGSYGIQALESGRLDARTIEAVRRVMTRQFKRSGQIWIRVLPYSSDVVELVSPVVIVAISHLSESEENDGVKDEIRPCRLDLDRLD